MKDNFVTVYRLEHKTIKTSMGFFLSPYFASALGESALPLEDKLMTNHSIVISNDRPTPYQDGLSDVFNLEYLCACPTLEALKEWFSCIIDEVFEYGFVVREYKVKQTHIGTSKIQCVFDKDDIISKRAIKII